MHSFNKSPIAHGMARVYMGFLSIHNGYFRTCSWGGGEEDLGTF
jgi:hypothetical protein